MPRALVALILALPLAARGMGLAEAKSYLGLEYARCSSWYVIMREVANRSYPQGLDRNMAMAQQQELAALAFERSVEATDREIALERAKAAMTEMMARMKNSLENLPVIAEDYAFSCKALMDSPDGRLQFWLEQK